MFGPSNFCYIENGNEGVKCAGANGLLQDGKVIRRCFGTYLNKALPNPTNLAYQYINLYAS